MTTAVKRKKLHGFIDTADDRKVEEIYTMVEKDMPIKLKEPNALSRAEKIELMKQASNDPLFLADMNEINEDFGFVDHENI
jgi:hypothetical protein